MKERPIIFNTEMIRAILEGKKTQTRRIIEPQPTNMNDKRRRDSVLSDCIKKYGDIGDRLWGRETWFCHPARINDKRWRKRFVIYKADDTIDNIKWKPSIHMPRWASRVILKITDIKVVRLQDMSINDMIKEGISSNFRGYEAVCQIEERWIKLWNSIYKNKECKYSWEGNPLVCAITFKRIL